MVAVGGDYPVGMLAGKCRSRRDPFGFKPEQKIQSGLMHRTAERFQPAGKTIRRFESIDEPRLGPPERPLPRELL